MLEKNDLKIGSKGSEVTLSFTLNENQAKTEVELTVDTVLWRVIKSSTKNEEYGQINTTYKYAKLDGKIVVTEITAEMGPVGRVTHTISDFKKTKRKSKKFFRLL